MGLFDSIGSIASKIVNSETAGKIFKPSNIINALGVYGAIKGGQDSSKLAAQTAKDQFANQITLQNLKQQGDLDSISLQQSGAAAMAAQAQAAAQAIAAMQISAAKKQAEFAAQNAAKQAQIGSTQTGGSLTMQALNNLIAATQRPLT